MNRIDKELVKRSLVPSRAKAQELIESSLVMCNNKVVNKCNYNVDDSTKITILDNNKLKYVSRGGLKLESAIDKINIDLTDLKIMDIGSSTGGFCDCALKHGASNIIAIDVGTNVMHEFLRNNPKIDLHEQTNFKDLEHKFFEDIDIITCDVSFISLKKIIDKISKENIKIDMICLIKPQFECGREIATKYKGIILNKEIHINIINDLVSYFNSLGFFIKNLTCSPISGGDGNIEYLAFITNKDSKNSDINYNEIVKKAFKAK